MVQSLPVPLPPADIVRSLGEFMEPGVPRSVWDAGCAEGRNSIHLASLGNFVLGTDISPDNLRIARQMAEFAGVAERCTFQEGDIRNSTPPGMFDVVLLNEVTHAMPKTAAQGALRAVRSRARQGGLNIVSGYVVRPGTANATNTRACFKPNELIDDYEAVGWLILDYVEEYLPNQYSGQKEHIFSRAKLIAQKPWTEPGNVIPRPRGPVLP
ncbi:MAG TPA: class I SAM-dependent methyltransferase [Candidatus Pristimantibacillus sp.]|nr:class I SAM-dependent methyltransferase [Candidatus Pristimantibacillus sp.]